MKVPPGSCPRLPRNRALPDLSVRIAGTRNRAILPFQIAFFCAGWDCRPVNVEIAPVRRAPRCPLDAGIAKGRKAAAVAEARSAAQMSSIIKPPATCARKARVRRRLKTPESNAPVLRIRRRSHSIILRLQNLPLRKTGYRSAVCSQILRGWPALYCMSSGFARRFSGGRCGIRRRAWKNTSSHVRR